MVQNFPLSKTLWDSKAQRMKCAQTTIQIQNNLRPKSNISISRQNLKSERLTIGRLQDTLFSETINSKVLTLVLLKTYA